MLNSWLITFHCLLIVEYSSPKNKFTLAPALQFHIDVLMCIIHSSISTRFYFENVWKYVSEWLLLWYTIKVHIIDITPVDLLDLGTLLDRRSQSKLLQNDFLVSVTDIPTMLETAHELSVGELEPALHYSVASRDSVFWPMSLYYGPVLVYDIYSVLSTTWFRKLKVKKLVALFH